MPRFRRMAGASPRPVYAPGARLALCVEELRQIDACRAIDLFTDGLTL